MGCTREELLRTSPLDFSPERQPDGRLSSEKVSELIQRALAGDPQFFEWHHKWSDGRNLFAEISLRRITLGSNALLLAVVRDVTRRKNSERDLQLRNRVYALASQINQAIVRISKSETLFKETCRLAVEHGKFRMAWIGLVDETSGESVL